MKKYLVALLMLFGLSHCTMASYWNDGGTHDVITTIDRNCSIRGVTTVNLYDTGIVTGGLGVFDWGTINIYGGVIYDGLSAVQNGKINIYSGVVTPFLFAFDYTNTQIHGGTIGAITFEGNTTCTISNAHVQDDVYLSLYSDTKVHGGIFDGEFYIYDKACCVFEGSEFYINNQEVYDGSHANDFQLTETTLRLDGIKYHCWTGALTGVLADGSALDTTFYLYDYYGHGYGDLSFSVIPEPATLSLFGIGILAVFRRKNIGN